MVDPLIPFKCVLIFSPSVEGGVPHGAVQPEGGPGGDSAAGVRASQGCPGTPGALEEERTLARGGRL